MYAMTGNSIAALWGRSRSSNMCKRGLSGGSARVTLVLFVGIALGASEGHGQEAWIGEAFDVPEYEWFVTVEGSGQATGIPDVGVHLLPPESSHDGVDAVLLRANAAADTGHPAVWATVSIVTTVTVAQASVCSFWMRVEREAMRFPVQTWYQTPVVMGFSGNPANWTNNDFTVMSLPVGDTAIQFKVSASADSYVMSGQPYPPNGTNYASMSLYLDQFAVEPMPSLSVSDASVVEGNVGLTSLVFNVTLSHAVSFDVVAYLAISNGVGCVQGEAGDYLALPDQPWLPAQVRVTAGTTSQQVVVSVVGDTLHEGDEHLWLYLSNPRYATLANAVGLGTIIDDDPPVPLVGLQASSGSMTLSWGASNGWVYTLQSTTNLLPPVEWSDCAPYVDLPGNGSTQSACAPLGPDPVRYFRVKVTESTP